MQATELALDHLLCAVGDPLADIRAVAPGDPEFVRALTIRAGTGVRAKRPAALPGIERAIRDADGRAASPQARAHLAAAEAWLAGRPILAAERYASILGRWPRDVLALRLAQSCYFFLGWHNQASALADALLPAWPPDHHNFGHVLAMASFARAEAGDAARAETLGRQALVRNPACPLGVHAVAHALGESGRPREGARWMREQVPQWVCESRMRLHNAWHLAMFDVDDGKPASALGILDAWLLPASARASLEACDAVALLWRLTIAGVRDEGRWGRLSHAFETTLTPGFWPYVDLHAGLAHAMAGRRAVKLRLAQAIEQRSGSSDYAAMRARSITLPGLRAIDAWAEGLYGKAAAQLTALRPLLVGAGGSRVQLELFWSIEREAARRQRAAAGARRKDSAMAAASP